jgi:hypothetical protein
MAAGGFVHDKYWLWQAENSFYWADEHPDMRWEQWGYYYLFRAVGYDGGI